MQEAQAPRDRGVPKIDTPARLVVAATREQELDPVLDMLAEAGFDRDGAGAGSRLPGLVELPGGHDLKSIAEWLRANDDAHLLLLFNAPVPWIARQMTDGVPPAEALEQWQIDAEKILAVVRRNRRRLSLLPLESSLAKPAVFMQALAERFGLGLDTPEPASRGPEAPRAMFRMMAENTIWQSVEAKNLAAELHVNALPVFSAADDTLAAVDEAYREFMELEMETATSKQQDTGAQPGEKEQELQTLRDEKKQTEARIQDLEEENELLLQQLHHVQEELESYYLNGVGTSQELEEARATIEAMSNSKSWKITRPLRWFLETFMGAEKAAR